MYRKIHGNKIIIILFAITTDDEQKLLAAVATIGPISVAIDASRMSFQLYNRGIYYEPLCRNDTVDHAVSQVILTSHLFLTKYKTTTQ